LKQHAELETFTNKFLAGYGSSDKTIYCCEGCSGCCQLAVHAAYPEVVPVAEGLSEKQENNLAAYIKRLKAALPEITSLKTYLKSHRQKIGPCPFLDTRGRCSIYSLRPLSCRALLSTRPAAWCTVDFSELSCWDKQAYESSLDRQVVAWPTHYVAATQSFAQGLENHLLLSMKQEKGWSLSGNFAMMTWLEHTSKLSERNITTKQQLHDLLTNSGLDHPLLFNLSVSDQTTRSPI
jgi:Fe-S-cluster containining protein